MGEFTSLYSLQQQKKDQGIKLTKTSDSVADLNKLLESEEDSQQQIRDELNDRQHLLTDTEMENKRHKVFIFQTSKLDPNLVIEKLVQVFKTEKLGCSQNHYCLVIRFT